MTSDDREPEPLAALIDRAEALVSLGRTRDAVAVLDDLVATYGLDDDPDVQERVGHALNTKAGLLLLSGDETGEALVVLGALVERLEGADGRDRKLRSQAMSNLGQGLVLAERYEETVDVLQRLVDEFGDDVDPDTRGCVAVALGNLSGLLNGVLDRPDEAEVAKARLLQDFGEEALTVLDAAATQGAQSLEPQRRMQRAGALYKKAELLRDLGRPIEAVSQVDALRTEYDGDEHPAVAQVLEAALELRAEITDAE